MIKFTLLFLFYLGPNIIWDLDIKAQSVKVHYKATAKHVSNSNKKTNNIMGDIAHHANNALSKIDFIVMSDNLSYKLYYELDMSNDFNGEEWTDVATMIAIDGDRVIGDFSEGLSYYDSSLTKKIRSVEMSNITWKITTESKFILGFSCYKAIASINDPSEENTLTPPEIAWFSPELSMRCGPTAYATLPGIILELESQKVKFTAVSIQHKIDSSLILPNYDSKNILTHKEWNAYFSANNPISRLKN